MKTQDRGSEVYFHFKDQINKDEKENKGTGGGKGEKSLE